MQLIDLWYAACLIVWLHCMQPHCWLWFLITTQLCLRTKGFTICSRSTELLTEQWSAAQHRKQRQWSAPPPSAGWRALIGCTWGHRSQAHTWNTTDSQNYTWWLKAAHTHSGAYLQWCSLMSTSSMHCPLFRQKLSNVLSQFCSTDRLTTWGRSSTCPKTQKGALKETAVFPLSGPLLALWMNQHVLSNHRQAQCGYITLPLQLHTCLIHVKLIAANTVFSAVSVTHRLLQSLV